MKPSTSLIVRMLLVVVAAIGGCTSDGTPLSIRSATCASATCSVCDESVWAGVTPDATTNLLVPAGVSLVADCDLVARTLTIDEGGALTASRTQSSSITLHGNLVLCGDLDYGTVDDRIPAGTTAEIIFTGMHDDDYVGTVSAAVYDPEIIAPADTPMSVIESDIGLWVMGAGRLRAAGQRKSAWSTLLDGAGAGDASFVVDDASGWEVGDRVALTPTAVLASGANFASEFDEGTVSAVAGGSVTLQTAPIYEHAGCAECMRRGEAANLTRNVVIRSLDDTAHAHIMIAQRALAQLDSVELRWLGPEKCGGPDRRAPLWFHQQTDAAADSFVRHVSIWGGQHHSLIVEKSNGIEISDVVGYDSYDDGFLLTYDFTACATRCLDREAAAPKNIVLDHVLAARIGVGLREEGCVRISHRMAGIDAVGGEGSGVRNSVAVGVGLEGIGEDISGFRWGEGGTGRPMDFTFASNVAHNIHGNGVLLWQNGQEQQRPYTDNAFWSVSARGMHWGAYDNAYQFDRTIVVDAGGASVGVKAIPTVDRVRMVGATVDDMQVLAYVFVQERVAVFRDITFTGARPIGVSQIHEACTMGDETNPDDTDCIRVWLRFENPVFPHGVVPFDFGMTFNQHSVWEVRGFSSPDYTDLPADFDLYRADNHIDGGSYYAAFDAWLVPR